MPSARKLLAFSVLLALPALLHGTAHQAEQGNSLDLLLIRGILSVSAETQCSHFRLLFSEHPQIDRRTTVQIFLQAENETIVINGEISVTVVDILEDEVVLAIDAPEWVEVCKKEAMEEPETVPLHPR